MTIGIYGVHNKTKDKWYIGSSDNLERRLTDHSNAFAQKDLTFCASKDMKDEFEFITLKTLRSAIELESYENFYMGKFDSITNGYNRVLSRRKPRLEITAVKTNIEDFVMLRKEDVIQFLNINDLDFEEMRLTKGFPFIRIASRTIRYCKEDILSWLYKKAALEMYHDEIASLEEGD